MSQADTPAGAGKEHEMGDLVEMGGAGANAAEIKKLTSADIKVGLATAFPAPGWRVFYEVGNDTGSKVRRHADAVAIGIWPSSGHKIHGFEIKVSRADFKSEMKDPTKAWPVMQHCHHWSLVTPPGLVKLDELPDNWGLLTYDGKCVRTVRTAPKLAPEALSAGFVAALVRRAGEQDSDILAAAVHKAKLEWQAAADKRGTRLDDWQVHELKRKAEEAGAVMARLRELFPDANEWNVEGIVAAVKAVRKAGLGHYDSVSKLATQMESAAKRIRDAYVGAGFELPNQEG